MALNVTDYRFVIVEVANDTEQQSVPFKAGQYILADTGEAWYDPSTGSELGDRVTLNSETAQALQSLTTRVSTAEGKITTLQSNMSTAQGDIAALEGRMDTAESDIAAVEADVSGIQDSLGAADGIATLDSSGKLVSTQIPDVLLGAVSYQGTWNATTGQDSGGTDIPEASEANKGHYYITATAGTWESIAFENGDWLISDGTNWSRVDTSDAVTSVAGKRGAVTLTTDDIEGLEDLIGSDLGVYYSVEATEEQEDVDALETVATSPKQSDVGVVRRKISDTGDKYSYTAYFYDDGTWKAMDGNYDATNVYFNSDLTATSTLGVWSPNSSGSVTIPIKDQTVYQALPTISAEAKDPTITQPSVSVTCTQMGSYEVGTTVTPQYSVTLNPGRYQYGPATGVTATSYSVTDTKSGSKSTATGSFDPFVVADGNNNYTITATVQHTAGATPKNNLGADRAELAIKAGSKSGTKSTVTGYRNSFYGTYTAKTTEGTTSESIRTLTKSGKALAAGSTFNIPITATSMRVVFAYPATLRDVNSVQDVNGMNAEIKSSFTKTTVSVEGADGYSAIQYKVYSMDFANAYGTTNTFKVTI